MLTRSLLKDQMLKSPLEAQSVVRPKNRKGKKTLLFSLTLTSLIDAFSILVIYLLLNFGASQSTVDISQGVDLPAASEMTTLDGGALIRIKDGKYFLEDKPVTLPEITAKLLDLRRRIEGKKEFNKGLVIEADKRM